VRGDERGFDGGKKNPRQKTVCALEPLIPAAKPGGRPQEIERREIVNVDSQSIKTSSVRGDKRGYDGGKKNPRQKTAPVGGHPRIADVSQSARSFPG
jgi:hypothetical protein